MEPICMSASKIIVQARTFSHTHRCFDLQVEWVTLFIVFLMKVVDLRVKHCALPRINVWSKFWVISIRSTRSIVFLANFTHKKINKNRNANICDNTKPAKYQKLSIPWRQSHYTMSQPVCYLEVYCEPTSYQSSTPIKKINLLPIVFFFLSPFVACGRLKVLWSFFF